MIKFFRLFPSKKKKGSLGCNRNFCLKKTKVVIENINRRFDLSPT